jgi:hypothetical protein
MIGMPRSWRFDLSTVSYFKNAILWLSQIIHQISSFAAEVGMKRPRTISNHSLSMMVSVSTCIVQKLHVSLTEPCS